MNALAVRANPGGAVTDPPFVFCEAVWTDGKSARAAPTEGEFFFTAMAGVVLFASAALVILCVIYHEFVWFGCGGKLYELYNIPIFQSDF